MLKFFIYSETCLKGPLKNRQKMIWKPCGILMDEQSAILLTYIKRLAVFKTYFRSSFEWLKTGFIYSRIYFEI